MANSDGQVVIEVSMDHSQFDSDYNWLKSQLGKLGSNFSADEISEKIEKAMQKSKSSVDEAVENINSKKAKPKISADNSDLKNKTEQSEKKLEKINGKRSKSKMTGDNSDLKEKASESKEVISKIPSTKKTKFIVEDRASESTEKIGSKVKNTTKKTQSFTDTLKGTALGMGIYQTAMTAGTAISEQFAGAISRYDTLNNFPKILQNMGVSAEDANSSIKILKDGVDGLPTSLDEVAQTTQTFIPLSKNAQEASKSALALNDAFLASGASSEDASRGLQQYTQMIARGAVDQQGWNSITETMNASLQKVARSFGITSGSTQQLYDKLKSGKITMKELNQRFIELDGGAKGFHQSALDATAGIGTAFTNLKTRTKNSITEIISGFDEMVKKITGKSIAQTINDLSSKFSNLGKSVGKSLSEAGDKINAFTTKMSPLKSLLPIIETGFKGVTTALLAFATIKTISSVISGITSAFKMLNATLKANPYIAVASAIMGIATALVSLYQHNAKFKKFVDDIIKNISKLISNVTKVAQSITKDFVGAFNKVAEPIKKAFNNIWKYIQPDLKTLEKNISSIMKSIQNTISTIVKTIQKIWDATWKQIQKIVTPILQSISKFVSQHMNQIKNIINSVTKIISTIWNTIWKQVENVFKLVWDVIFHKSKVIQDIKNIIDTQIKAIQKIWQQIWKIIQNYFDIVWDEMKDIAKTAINWIKNIIDDVVNTIQDIWKKVWNTIKDFFGDIWDGIKNTANKSVNWVKDTLSSILGSIKDNWNNMWQSMSDFFGSIWKDIKKYAQDGINGVINVINAGIDGIDAVWKFFTGKETSIHHLSPVKFAQGGIVDRHLSMVNDGDGDDWKELIETPDGDLMMSNERNAILPLEPGTRVYNGSETRQIMSMLGVDHYANGGFVGGIQRFKDGGVVGDLIDWGAHELKNFGSWIKDKWDAVTKFLKHPLENTKEIIKKAITSPLNKLENSNMVSLGKGVFDKLTSPISKWFEKGLKEAKQKHDEETSAAGVTAKNIGAGAKNWTDTIKKVAKEMKVDLSDSDLNLILWRINKESGGNQSIKQQVWDVNMANGTPAQGLLQYVPSTFASWMVSGHNNILSGEDQLYAMFNDSNWRHDIANSGGWGPTGHRRFDNGGIINQPELAWLAEKNREFVINPQRNSADNLLKLAAEERLAYEPNSDVAKAITGMSTARANSGSLVTNSLLTGSQYQSTSNVSGDRNNESLGNIFLQIDGKTIAQASYPYQKVIQGQDIMLQNRIGGATFG